MTTTSKCRQNDCDNITAETTRHVDGPPISDDDSNGSFEIVLDLEDPIPIHNTRKRKTKPQSKRPKKKSRVSSRR